MSMEQFGSQMPEEQDDASQEPVEELTEADIIEEESPKSGPKVKKLSRFGSFAAGLASVIGVGAASNSAEAAPRYIQPVNGHEKVAPAHEEEPVMSVEQLKEGVQDLNDYLHDTGHGLERYIVEFNQNNSSKIYVLDDKQKIVSTVDFLKDKTISGLLTKFQKFQKEINSLNPSVELEKAKIDVIKQHQFRAMERDLEALTR